MKTTRTNIRRWLFLSMCLVGVAFVPATASARTQPASSGRAVAAADYGCFSLWFSSMTNRCGGTRNLEIPLVIDNAGRKTVEITAYGATHANNVCCHTVGVNRQVTAIWRSPRRCLGGFGSSQIITTMGAFVPPGGFAYTVCDVAPGGRVNTVAFNQ